MADPSIVVAIVAGAATVMASFAGGRQGARRELNGTARAVRDIQSTQQAHVLSTAGEFLGIREELMDLVDRVGTMEGYLKGQSEHRQQGGR